MGLNNSPYFCTQALNKLFRHQIGVFMLVYVDDILVASPDPKTHLEHLRIIFTKLREANLKLHPKKCQIALPELKYLGFIFNSNGYFPSPDKVSVIINYPQPKNVKEVRSFTGLCNFYRKGIQNYTDKIYGLTKLLRKDVNFVWGPEQKLSFQAMKFALSTPPVMTLIHPTAPIYLTCDASDISVSFNLSQIIDGKERVIEFGARGLRPAEKSYSVAEKECLAIVSGVQHYHEYLNGRSFTIRTDHQALKYLKSMRHHSTGRLARWNLLLSGYDYQVEFVKGSTNSASDALSRISLPVPEEGPEKELDNMLFNIDTDIFQSTADRQNQKSKRRLTEICVVQDVQSCCLGSTGSLNSVTDNCKELSECDIVDQFDVGAAQLQCPDCANIIAYLTDGSLPSDNALARKIVMQADNYVYHNQTLYHLHTTRRKRLNQIDPVVKQLVIPRSLREFILKNYHDNNNHIGMDKIYETIRHKFYWPNLYADVHAWIKSCAACQKGKLGKQNKAPLRSVEIEASIFDRWHIDHLQLTPVDGFKYVLVCIDSFSLFSVLLPAKTTSAEETATLLFDNIFNVFGCKSILSDRGSCFTSKLLKELCRLLNIKQIRSSPRHPASNSRCESFNKNVLNALRTRCTGYKNWPSLLSSIGYSFRTSILTNLGVSPYRVVFGIDPKMAIDLALVPSTNLPTDVKIYIEEKTPHLEIIRDVVRRNQQDANTRTQKYYNVGSKVPGINVGDRVLLYSPSSVGPKLSHKCRPKYVGPMLVVDKHPDYYTFKLQDCQTKKILRPWIHANRLKLFCDSRDKFYTGVKSGETPDVHIRSTACPVPAQQAGNATLRSDSKFSQSTAQDSRATTATVAAAATDAASLTPFVAEQSKQTDTQNDWYEIADILNHKRVKGVLYYLVKWCVGGRDWVPIHDITQRAIDEYYLKRQRLAQRRRKRRRT